MVSQARGMVRSILFILLVIKCLFSKIATDQSSTLHQKRQPLKEIRPYQKMLMARLQTVKQNLYVSYTMSLNPYKPSILFVCRGGGGGGGGGQCLSDRVLKPHWRQCVVSLSKTINPSLLLVQPRKTCPFITVRLLLGRKESNQTNFLFVRHSETSANCVNPNRRRHILWCLIWVCNVFLQNGLLKFE